MQEGSPQITWHAHKSQDASPDHAPCRRHGRMVNKKNEVGTTIEHCYRCKECAFECATRATCIAHARRKHTEELIGPCNYCGTCYAHSADSMKHHVNECAGSTSSDNTDD